MWVVWTAGALAGARPGRWAMARCAVQEGGLPGWAQRVRALRPCVNVRKSACCSAVLGRARDGRVAMRTVADGSGNSASTPRKIPDAGRLA